MFEVYHMLTTCYDLAHIHIPVWSCLSNNHHIIWSGNTTQFVACLGYVIRHLEISLRGRDRRSTPVVNFRLFGLGRKKKCTPQKLLHLFLQCQPSTYFFLKLWEMRLCKQPNPRLGESYCAVIGEHCCTYDAKRTFWKSSIWLLGGDSEKCTLPETNIVPLKMVVSNRNLRDSRGLFSGVPC